jgi:Na+/H+-dicarboxylate symporter
VTLEETKRALGVSATVSDLVLPLGASMYRAGSALFQGGALVFLADLYDVAMPLTAVGGAVLATFMVSLTVAPVPSSGVVTLAPALDTVGIPISGLSILLGVDRIPDMFRSTTNLLGQVTAAVAMDTWVDEDVKEWEDGPYEAVAESGDGRLDRY